MEKRGPKGAKTGQRGDARKGGYRKPDARPASAAKPVGGKPSITSYPDLDKRRRIEDAEKAALGRVDVLAGDAVALGCNSSGWPEFQDRLRARLLQLDRAKILLPDRIAAIWNKDGFKTGAGRQWTVRLVEVAKKILIDATPAEPKAPPA
jgi:hypothetical protein